MWVEEKSSVDISEIWNIKLIEKINETKSWFFEKKNQENELVSRQPKKKGHK